MAGKVIRFASGPASCPSSSNWRLWVKGSEIYLATRQTGGEFKLSLHSSGTWNSAFTFESNARLTDRGSGRVTRRHSTWTRPAEFAPGWTKGPSVVIPWVSWHDELTGPVVYHPETTWYPAPPEAGEICFTLLISSAEKTASSLGEVLHANYMYETEPLRLANSEQVWLCAELLEMTPEQVRYVDAVSAHFMGFSWKVAPDQAKAYAQDIHRDSELPLIIDFQLGRKHFGMS
jgi:hypothetical protein